MSELEVDVLGSAIKLAEIFKEDPKAIDQNEYKRGDAMLVIYTDANFSGNMAGLRENKCDVIARSIDDLSDRAKILSKSYLGVTFLNNQLDVFESTYSENPKGSVVFKVGLKNVAAFQKWRTGQVSEISAEDIHAAIYRLTIEWSKNL